MKQISEQSLQPTDYSRLGRELGEQFHKILVDLLMSAPIPETLSQMEQGVRTAMLTLGNTVLSTWLALQNDRYPAPTIPCRCGATAHYREMRDAVLHTVLGRIEYRRAYYVCPSCHEGTCPLDERLGLRPGELSAKLEDLSAQTGAQLPFGQGSDLFQQLTMLSISPQTMDTVTQALGAEMESVEAEWIATSQDPEALLRQEREEPAPERLYGSLDATKVHTNERRDATDQGWRDLKIGCWFETDARPPEQPDGEWDVQAKNMTYYCDIAEAETFGTLMWATGFQRRAPRAKELVFVGDGAEWIWNQVTEHFPHALQIVDWFHAAEHLTAVAAVMGSTATDRDAWYRRVRDDLWGGRVNAVITACAALARPGCKDDPAQQAVTYFSNNRQRMNYPAYRAKGYQIGSGTV